MKNFSYVRLSHENSSAKPTPPVVDQNQQRQARLDRLNATGPRRGAKGHRRVKMSMEQADLLFARQFRGR